MDRLTTTTAHQETAMTTNRPLATVPLYQALIHRHRGRVSNVYLAAPAGMGARSLEATLAQVGTAQGLEGQEDLAEVLSSTEYRYHQDFHHGRGEVRVMSHLGKPTIKVRGCQYAATHLANVIQAAASALAEPVTLTRVP